MLVVARKYNDIFYAISTEEWNGCQVHHLIMLTDRLDGSEFPMQELFDRVTPIHIELGRQGIVKQIIQLHKILEKTGYDVVTISNIATIANLYILKCIKAADILLIEDGLMNYCDFKPSADIRKRMLMRLLRINEKKIWPRISKTYLLQPDTAVYYYGLPTQLGIKTTLFAEKAHIEPSIAGKAIFVGQDLYRYGNITVEQYSRMVNQLIQHFHIDYYLPHTMASEKENVNAPRYDIVASLATLEIAASIYDFTIYSFSSSTLYTTKLINPRMKTYAIHSKELHHPVGDNIIYRLVDGTINI